MIRRLTGSIVAQQPDWIILDVSGVGYQVFTAQAGTSFNPKETLTLHIHHAIRETASDLYGFTLLDELEIFELLLTLPKIGPKSAMQIMVQADIELLKEAVQNQDATYLSKMSGIGKKTAEKIVTELQDKFESLGITPNLVAGATAIPIGNYHNDAIDALIALGYPAHDARKTVQQLPATINDTNEAVREALKHLSQ